MVIPRGHGAAMHLKLEKERKKGRKQKTRQYKTILSKHNNIHVMAGPVLML
jgi:hypothetical protein